MSRSRPFVQLILDFDGTLTRSDTLGVLGSIARISGRTTSTSWNQIVTAYLDDYRAHRSAYLPAESARTSLAEEAAWLHSMRSVERQSARRVERAGFFQGVTSSMISTLATQAVQRGDVELRPGWRELLCLSSRHQHVKPTILSVNWSTTFIRQVLFAGVREDATTSGHPDLGKLAQLNISSNEIEGIDHSDGSDGGLNSAGGIRTSADKLDRLNDITSTTAPSQDSTLVLYVGDSITDLECLVRADIGICVRSDAPTSGQQELARCLDRINIPVVHLSGVYPQHQRARPLDPRQLYWTTDLREVARLLDTL